MSDWKNVQYENGKYRTSEGGGGGSSTFADLDDVSFSNIQNGQVAKYNSTTQKWENANESGGVGALSDLTDVDLTNIVDRQILKWDATNSKWVNANENSRVVTYITSYSLTPSLTRDTNNLIQTISVLETGYYIIGFVEQYQRSNNRSSLGVEITANKGYFTDTHLNNYTDVRSDIGGWTTFTRSIPIYISDITAEIGFYLWGNGYNPSLVTIVVNKLN